MPEMHASAHPDRPSGDALLYQAVLYAEGDLEAADAVSFERRLGEDQAAREALCQAMQLTPALAGRTPPLPDPAYRARVVRRLRPSAWRALLTQRSYRGHPLLWSGLGAVAAALVMVGLAGLPGRMDGEPALHGVVPREPMVGVRGVEQSWGSAVQTANVWAELHNSDHLARAHEEEVRRKSRPEGRIGQIEEQRLGTPGNTAPRH